MLDDNESIAIPSAWPLAPEITAYVASMLTMDLKSFSQMKASCRFFDSALQPNLLNLIRRKIPQQVALTDNGHLIVHKNGEISHYTLNNTGELVRHSTNALLKDICQVCTGKDFTLFLKIDGTVWMHNQSAISDDNHFNLLVQQPIDNVSHIVFNKSCSRWFYLKKNGEVWAYRPNPMAATEPTQISNLFNITQGVITKTHTLFLDQKGAVWACGSNGFGQLGVGDKEKRYQPVKIPNLNNITQIAADRSQSVFLRRDGTAWVCGILSRGLLDTLIALTPVRIADVTDVTYIAAQNGNTFLAMKDGTVWIYKNNTLFLIRNVTDAKEIVAMPETTLFIHKDGTITGSGKLNSLGIKSHQAGVVDIPCLNRWQEVEKYIILSHSARVPQDMETEVPTPTQQ